MPNPKPETPNPMPPRKWGGIAALTKAVFESAHLKGCHEVEAELRRRVEPLLLTAEKVADWTDDLHNSNHKALRKELDLWK